MKKITLFLLLVLAVGFTPVVFAENNPYILAVTAQKPDGWYGVGTNIEIAIDFSEPVYGSNLVLYLNTGRTCNFSASNTLRATCNYVVQSGDYASPLRVNYITGSAYDSSGYPVLDWTPRQNLDSNRNIRVGDYGSSNNSGNPYIVSITSSKGDAWYGAGQMIDLIVEFSEPVQSNNVQLYLNTNRTCAFSIWNSSRGTCNYVVQSGDYASPLRVTSISGSIQDYSGYSVTDFTPRENLDRFRSIRVGNNGYGSNYCGYTSSGTYTCDNNYNYNNSNYCYYNSYGAYTCNNSYNYNYGSSGDVVSELMRQIQALQQQLATLQQNSGYGNIIVEEDEPGQVLGAYTVHVPFLPSEITRDLYYGMTGEDVGVLQGLLTAEGWYVPPTGYFGPKTQAALISYQRRIGYPQTGVFDASMRNYVRTRGY